MHAFKTTYLHLSARSNLARMEEAHIGFGAAGVTFAIGRLAGATLT